MSEIYSPAEDSYLMSETLKKKLPGLLKKNPNLRLLEIGCGSGFNMQTLVSLGVNKKNIFSCDINNEAVNHCKKLGFNCVRSDLFENVRGKFDVIFFNPPYLPFDKDEPNDSRLNTTGGKRGSETILRFLKEVKNYLANGGKIILITSSLSKDINFKKFNYRAKIVGSKKLFFEKINCWELIL